MNAGLLGSCSLESSLISRTEARKVNTERERGEERKYVIQEKEEGRGGEERERMREAETETETETGTENDPYL